MRRAAAVLALCLASLAGSQEIPAGWQDVARKPLRDFTIPQPRRIELPNGLILFLIEDHELPLLQATAMLRYGPRDEPAAKAGMSQILSEAWRSGGTTRRSGDDLDDFLESRAAKVESWVGIASSGMSLSCLKEDFGPVFDVFVELLREPAFAPDKVELARAQVQTAITRRNDDPEEIASREIRKLVYGADSPYARTPELETVARVRREDLVEWHRRYVRPDRILLGISGDFDAGAMERRVRAAVEDWPRGPAFTQPPAPYRREPRPGVFLAAKKDVDQSNIRVAHLGTTRNNPDYYALEVMNQIFGGGFASRLFSEIRSKQALAYEVWGGVGAEYDYPGMFLVGMGTRSASTARGIRALLSEIDRLQREPPDARELASAKDAILNSFIFRYDSKEKVLREQMRFAFFGYPADFLERYRAGVEKVTAGDVLRVAKKYVRKNELSILVVGNPAEIPGLDAVGKVQKVDISIPGTKSP
jgi:zinc protease